jgi:hypothetical protein
MRTEGNSVAQLAVQQGGFKIAPFGPVEINQMLATPAEFRWQPPA